MLGGRLHELPAWFCPDRRNRREDTLCLSSIPLPDAVIAEFQRMEEKGPDLGLADHLLNDVWLGLFESAVVVSSDTDLVTSVRMVAQELKRQDLAVWPGRWRIVPQVRNAAAHVRHIRAAPLSGLWRESAVATVGSGLL